MSFFTERNATIAPTTARDCLFGEFRCKNGKCININRTCDQNNDCEDESDESPPKCAGNATEILIVNIFQHITDGL